MQALADRIGYPGLSVDAACCEAAKPDTRVPVEAMPLDTGRSAADRPGPNGGTPDVAGTDAKHRHGEGVARQHGVEDGSGFPARGVWRWPAGDGHAGMPPCACRLARKGYAVWHEYLPCATAGGSWQAWLTRRFGARRLPMVQRRGGACWRWCRGGRRGVVNAGVSGRHCGMVWFCEGRFLKLCRGRGAWRRWPAEDKIVRTPVTCHTIATATGIRHEEDNPHPAIRRT